MTRQKNTQWQQSSWRKFPIKQQPIYSDLKKLAKIEAKLSSYPALIYFDEAIKLKKQLANVAKGKAFLLQGGDCAESFAEFNEQNLKLYFQIILQMTAVLMYGLNKPIVKLGRIAGQFAKPRSSDFENINGEEIPSYRGDMVNSITQNTEERIPNPQNLIRAYQQSAATLNFIRSLASGGFASLDNIYSWLNDFSDIAKKNNKINHIIEDIAKSSSFFKACGYDLSAHKDYNSAEFYTSH
ncbi:MAG: 3-deoxy-7-phosphoheptulonate synthase [Rickettsiales bacterium]